MKTKKRGVAVESKGEEESKGISTVAAMLMLVFAGLICVAGLQHFREIKSSAFPATQKDAPEVATRGPSWHLQLKDVPAQKAFIGFKYGNHIYIDVSELCLQPGFREYADDGGVGNENTSRLLSETPDIRLPDELAQGVWWVISSEVLPEDRIFNTPYQWLGSATPPYNYACLFLGQRSGQKIVRQFSTEESEPVIGLMGFEAPLDLHLKEHEGWINVTDDNRAVTMRQLPWLHSWMNKFGGKGDELCGYSEGMTPDVALLPIKVKILPNGQQDAHWLAATGCDVLDRWSLVMANEDGTVSFITVTMPPETENYRPAKVWTVDIDNDGAPEFLIKAQYYEGAKYVLLRMNKNGKGGYYLTEIAGTSYEGL